MKKYLGSDMNQSELQRIYDTWIPLFEKDFSKKGKKKVSQKRLQSMALMAHTRMKVGGGRNGLFEGVASTPQNTPGRGSVALGNNPASGLSAFYGTNRGSGDVFQNLFSVFTEIAAFTVGMDLVPIVPMAKSSGTIYIVEPIYADGKLDSAANKPTIIQVKGIATGTAPTLVVGTSYDLKTDATAPTAGEVIGSVTYVGRSRINGNFIFQIGTLNDNTGGGGTDWTSALVADLFDTAGSDAAIYTDASNYQGFDPATVDYVEGFLNFVGGFSGAGLTDSNPWFVGRQNGTNFNAPMERGTGEAMVSRSMGLRNWSRNFSAETFKVDLATTREFIQDLQSDHGVDAMEMVDRVLADQVTQAINDYILSRIFSLGWSHHGAMVEGGDKNLNLNFDVSGNTSAAATYVGKDGVGLQIAGTAGVLPASAAISENLSTLQRRLVTRITLASRQIAKRSRRGKGDFAVMNTDLASAIMDVAGFTPAPFDNSLTEGDLAYRGDLNGIKIYEDTLMGDNDTRICVGRKGDEGDPGLKMAPHTLASAIETVPEGSFGSRTQMMSRVGFPECGSNPELNYITFKVDNAAGFELT